MKIWIYTTLLMLLTFTAASCTQHEPTPKIICKNSCENETTVKELKDVSAKIIRVCTDLDENGDHTNCIYAISTDEAWLDKETWPEPSDNILVPCEGIPEEFQKVNLKVSISGFKKSCCDLLTKPEIWGAFGCKFEITAIEPFHN